MKTLVTRPHMLLDVCVGIQVGWSIPIEGELPHVVYWGSTRDECTLKSLIHDMRSNHNEEFIYNPKQEGDA